MRLGFEAGQAKLEGDLNEARVRRREGVLSWDSGAGPLSSVQFGIEVRYLLYELFAKSDGSFRVENCVLPIFAAARRSARSVVNTGEDESNPATVVRFGATIQIGRIGVVFARYADQGEEGVTAGIGQRRPDAMG